MARNKTPEVTVNRILDAAMELFQQKGYEHTTIQDIIDALGDLSKGAIYHHFKSKEDILDRVGSRFDGIMSDKLIQVRDDPKYTGLEKIKQMLRLSLGDPQQLAMLRIMPVKYMDSCMLMGYLQNAAVTLVDQFIEPVVLQGVADGSIHTEHPRLLSEAMMVLCNIWINPFLLPVSPETFVEKAMFVGQMMERMGMPLMDDELIEMIRVYRELRPMEPSAQE